MHSKTISYYDHKYQVPFFGEEGMGKQNEAKIFSLTDTHTPTFIPTNWKGSSHIETYRKQHKNLNFYFSCDVSIGKLEC